MREILADSPAVAVLRVVAAGQVTNGGQLGIELPHPTGRPRYSVHDHVSSIARTLMAVGKITYLAVGVLAIGDGCAAIGLIFAGRPIEGGGLGMASGAVFMALGAVRLRRLKRTGH
jgi:hypothetical protein